MSTCRPHRHDSGVHSSPPRERVRLPGTDGYNATDASAHEGKHLASSSLCRAVNHASRAAVARLGAKQDGVLRNHDLWRDGTVRDIVVFSIIDSEWKTVKLSLQQMLTSR